MKASKLSALLALLLLVVSSCASQNEKQQELTSARDSIVVLQNTIDSLEVKVIKLSYTAEQRYQSAVSNFNNGNFSEALKEIKELCQIFPKSQEAVKGEELTIRITEAEAAKRAEQERIKALGFKAVKPNLTAKIGENSVSFSNFTTSTKYTYDACPSARRFEEEVADRDNKFVLTTMKVVSTSPNPQLPIPAIYKIVGDRMRLVSTFQINFAVWKDFGHFLRASEKGVENDFAKTNTISFKLGCQISDELLKSPYAIVLKLSNTLSRKYGRTRNTWPDVYYDGPTGYPSELSIEDFNDKYQVLKISNL